MKKILIFSRHFGFSERKAGFHHLCDNLKNKYDVTFITVDFSILSYFANDYRNKIKKKYINSLQTEDGFSCYLRKTAFHPLGINRIIDFFTSPFVYLYVCLFFNREVKKQTFEADIVLFESSNAVIFLKKIKKLNHQAKIIYRVSDLVKELTHIHYSVVKADNKVNVFCDEVSTGNSYIFDCLSGTVTNTKLYLDCHGIDKKLFDDCSVNPYNCSNKKKVIFVGASKVDIEGLNKIAFLNPNYEFHYFGPLIGLEIYENVHFYGEKKFADIVPYIKYADIGLQFIKHKSIKEYGDSLKVLQYTYCNLPIIAPEGILTKRENFIFFDQNNYTTLKDIFNKISPIKKELSKQIDDWATVANRIIDRII